MPRGRFNLAGMSIEALLALRDNVGRVLSQKTSELRKQLQELEFGGYRPPGAKGAKLGRRGGIVPPKYRDPENPSNVWAGRGAVPRWMQEKIRAGAKREDFLIGASRTPQRKKRLKKSLRRAKPKTKAMAKITRKSKRTMAEPKLSGTTGKKRRSAAKLPQTAPSSAAATESAGG